MRRLAFVLTLCLPLALCLAGCAEKHHPPEVDTTWITAMAVVVSQEAGQPVSLTLVESEVTRPLYRRFHLVTATQLATVIGDYRFPRTLALDPESVAEIGRLTGVDAILQATVTGHEIDFSGPGQYRAHTALAMQLVEVPSGAIRWSRSARSARSAGSISEAVHESVSTAVWDCLKYLVGWESIVQGRSLVQVCSDTGLTLSAPPGSPARGVSVQAVAPDSFWHAAGLRPGDIITRLDGRPIEPAPLEWAGDRPPERVSLTVKRGDALLDITVPLDPQALTPDPRNRPH